MRLTIALLVLLCLVPTWAEDSEAILGRAMERLKAYKEIPDSQNGYIDLMALDLPEESDSEAFRQVYPRIRSAVLKPHFSPPQNWDSGSKLDIKYFKILQICEGLVSLAGHYEEVGEYEKALECYQIGITMGSRISGQGPVIYQLVSISVAEKALSPCLNLMGSGNLSAESCRNTIRFVDALPILESDFLRSSEMELAFLHNYKHTRESSPEEISKFEDVYFAVLPEIASLEPGKVAMPNYEPQSEEMRDYREVFRKGGIVWRSYLTRLSALKLVAAISAYRSEEGYPPEALADLTPPYVQKIPPNYLSPNGEFSYKREGTSFTLSTLSGFGDPIKAKDLQYYPRLSYTK